MLPAGKQFILLLVLPLRDRRCMLTLIQLIIIRNFKKYKNKKNDCRTIAEKMEPQVIYR